MLDNVLTIKDLHVTYETDDGTVYAVNGLDLTLPKAHTLGLVGETGAGKTTTALSVMRLLPLRVGNVTQGEISLEGRELLQLREADMRLIRGKDVSMIFQDPMTALNPILTVGAQIAEVVSLHNPEMSADQIQERVDGMLQKVGISADRKNDYPHQFSGGMKQRIVIAIALACNPKVLIADEPTTALDVTIQAQVLKMIRTLREEYGTAMLLITHDLGIVAQTCDSVAVMYAGEVIEAGTVEDIFEGDDHHPYTIGLFGSIPNLESKSDRLKPIDGLMPDPGLRLPGCSFAPRCPKCTKECTQCKPQKVVNGSHMIKCHLYN